MAQEFLDAGADGWAGSPKEVRPGQDRSAFPPLLMLGYGLLFAAVLVAMHLWSATDYVGNDNDDVMRLIEVRDLLNGQSWFDTMQYRLGLADGTLMHWSRFVDLPIASLIAFFRLFAGPEKAEALALAVWPVSLSVTIVWLMGLAAFRLGGRVVMHIASCMTILFAYGIGRFGPGSIDHHNVQLTLAALILAMLLDPGKRARSYAIAGFAAGMGLAIGAETLPFVATVCVVVALQWGWQGEDLRRQTAAYALSLVLTVTAAFFATTPPHLYSMVTCDNLSLGFYALSSIGGGLLLVLALAGYRLSRLQRFAGLAVTGAVVLGAAKVIAPQCLGNPLASLDPLLVELWLSKVVEARSFIAILHEEPSAIGSFYAVGFLALLVCAWRILRRDRTEPHMMFAAFIAICFGVALVQVRGTGYLNLLAILPLAMMIGDLREWQQDRPNDPRRALAYIGSVLVSIPFAWAVLGLVASTGFSKLATQMTMPREAARTAKCLTPQSLAPLAGEPAGVVMGSSEMGVQVLRYTPHRALSAPYHRNQGGMLTELNAGLSLPSETIAFLRGAGVNFVLFCPSDPPTRQLAKMKPDGFYAALTRGEVPAYLTPIAGKTGDMQIFRVKLD